MKKYIKKSFLGIVVLLVSNDISFAAEEDESFSDLAMSRQTSCETGEKDFSSFDPASEERFHKRSRKIKKKARKAPEKCLFTDWMDPIGRNTFNGMEDEDRQNFRKKVAEQASQLAAFIYEKHGHKGIKEDSSTIAGYIRQIANGQNPIGEDPLSVKANKKHPNYQLVRRIEEVLYKAVTGQILLVNGHAVDSQALKYLELSKLPSGCSISVGL